MEYKIATEKTPEAVKLIESAEIEILEYTRKAVLGFYSKDRFKRDIDDIINRLAERLKNPTLRDKARKGLQTYALRCYAKEKRILTLHVSFYAVLLKGKRENKPEVAETLKIFKESLDKEYRSSKGFLTLLERRLPDTVYPTSLPLDIYHKEYMNKVKDVYNQLIKDNAKERYETNVSLRNIAEMTVRYEHQTDMIAQKRAEGKKLVYILAHANCSERCAKYQVGGTKHSSGLYSLDGTEGVTPEGVKYKPLEFATDNPDDRYTTKAGITYQNGCLTGFNCRHKLGDYKPGVKPLPIPTEYIEKRRAIEERQRAFEREIRQYKRAAIVSDNPKQRAAFKKAAENKTEQYRAFSRKNEAAYFKERESVFEKELTPLTNSEEKRILYINNRDVRKIYHKGIENISNSIDKNLPLEEQARQAHALRNAARTNARDIMADLGARAKLDTERKNVDFDELLESKLKKVGTVEQAYRSIIESASRSNANVDEFLHIKRKGK